MVGGGISGRVGGGIGSTAGGRSPRGGGVRATHYYHMQPSRGDVCLGVWRHGGMRGRGLPWYKGSTTRTKHMVLPSTKDLKKKKGRHCWRHDPHTTISQNLGREGGGGANKDQPPPPRWVSITDAAASWVGKYCTWCSSRIGANPCVCKSVEWQFGAHGKVAVAGTLTPNEIPPHFQGQACTSPWNLLIHLDQLPVPLERRRCSEVKAKNGRHQEVSQQLMTGLRLAGRSFTRNTHCPSHRQPAIS